jgi:hypothetical protein
MKATILDLRYRMNDVLKAIERNEKVSISYHGKEKGVIISGAGRSAGKVTQHPFFNMRKTGRGTIMTKEPFLIKPPKHAPRRRKEKSVEEEMAKLRGGRYRDL